MPKASKAEIKRKIRALNRFKGLGFAGAGKWVGTSEIRNERSYNAERTAQFLRQLSAAIFFHIKHSIKDTEQEVQCMHLNDRIVISSNLNFLHSVIDNLEEKIKNAVKTAGQASIFSDFLRDDLTDDVRAERVEKKLKAVLDGSRLNMEPVIKNLNEILANPAGYTAELNYTDAADCKLKLAGSAYKNKLIFVTAPDNDYEVTGVKDFAIKYPFKTIHAEQKLVIALCNAGITSSVEIRGKKRPCVHCSVTMQFYNDKFNGSIKFNENPGGMWDTSLDPLVYLFAVAKQKGKINDDGYKSLIAKYKDIKTHVSASTTKAGKKSQTSGWDTGSDSDSD